PQATVGAASRGPRRPFPRPILGCMPQPVDAAKRALRSTVRARRRARDAAAREADAESLSAALVLLAEATGARTIAAYLSRADEPDTRGFLAWAADRGL